MASTPIYVARMLYAEYLHMYYVGMYLERYVWKPMLLGFIGSPTKIGSFLLAARAHPHQRRHSRLRIFTG